MLSAAADSAGLLAWSSCCQYFTYAVDVFGCRAPDTAKIKAKMMYASTKDFFKGHLDGVSIELQANEHDDITEDAIGDSVKSVITRQ